MTAARELGFEEHIPPHVFRYVERELYDYPVHRATVDEYEQNRQDILHRYRQWEPGEGGRPEGVPSDMTGDNVLRLEALEMRTERARRNVTMVESVLRTLDDEQRELVRLKYRVVLPEDGERDIQPPEQSLTNEQVIAEMSMSRKRFYEMRSEVVRRFALRMGLI